MLCRYMLTENDILAQHWHLTVLPLRIIRWTAMEGASSATHTGTYGIPYRCLLPVDIDNLLPDASPASAVLPHPAAVCRAMMQLGYVAGLAAAQSRLQRISQAMSI